MGVFSSIQNIKFFMWWVRFFFIFLAFFGPLKAKIQNREWISFYQKIYMMFSFILQNDKPKPKIFKMKWGTKHTWWMTTTRALAAPWRSSSRSYHATDLCGLWSTSKRIGPAPQAVRDRIAVLCMHACVVLWPSAISHLISHAHSRRPDLIWSDPLASPPLRRDLAALPGQIHAYAFIISLVVGWWPRACTGACMRSTIRLSLVFSDLKRWRIIAILGPCLGTTLQIPNFYILSVTSNFGHMHGALNIDKK
jgi:hypothetical protein